MLFEACIIQKILRPNIFYYTEKHLTQPCYRAWENDVDDIDENGQKKDNQRYRTMSRYLKRVFSIGAGLMKHRSLCVYFFSLRGLSVKTVFCAYACVFSFKRYSLSSDTPLALRFAVIKKTKHHKTPVRKTKF